MEIYSESRFAQEVPDREKTGFLFSKYGLAVALSVKIAYI